MWMKIVCDALIINFSFALAYLLRFKFMLFLPTDLVPIFEHYLRVLIFITILWLAVFKFVGLYESKRSAALIDEIAGLFLGVTLSTLLLLGLLFLYREFWFSRLVLVNAWLIAFVLLAGFRLLIFFLQRWWYALGWGVRRILILGTDEIGQVLANKIRNDRALGYKIVGFLDDDPGKKGQSFFGFPVLDVISIAKIKELIENERVEEIIIAGGGLKTEKILDIITECERYGIEFKIVPGILELISSRLDVDELGGIPLLTVTEIQLQGLNALLKRLVDLVLSVLLIIILSPILILFALLVKITSPGTVFFPHQRIGLNGKPFAMLKFRSMVKEAEAIFPQLKHLSEVEGHIFKMKDDPRVTPLGRFMRRWSIDELPQLFNVFLGQMSLVGPRPPLPREVEKYSPWHKKRLRVRPGITGLWQVSGRSLLPFEEMVRLDIYYIENWSLWQDIKILLRSLPVVIFGTGAY